MRSRFPEAKARPPVMLVHGEADPMVPSARMVQAKESLETVGIKVKSHLRPGLGHGIDPEGLALGGRFLAEALANA
jgi:phospholipase/carboxylesterase